MIKNIGDVVKGKNADYLLKAEIGGGANEAFIAENQSNKKEYFLKIYNAPRRASHEADFDDFLKLQHDVAERLAEVPDITKITEKLVEDFLIDDNIYCCVKEVRVGKHLRKLILEDLESLSEEEALGLAVVFIGVLKQVHSKGLIHGDLKPEQIFCESDESINFKWKISVTDFDFSLLDGKRWGDVVYTPGYQSPEVIKNENVSEKSDIFTSGIILGEMLIGGYVYNAENEEELEEKILSSSIDQTVLGLIEQTYRNGTEIAKLIGSMLDPDKENRPEIEAIHKVLISAFEAQGLPEKPKVPEILEFHSDEKKVVIYENEKDFNSNSFRVFGKDKSQYVSRELQFSIKKDENGWKISGSPSVTNDTLLNGNSISGKEEYLNLHDKIEIGPLEINVEWI